MRGQATIEGTPFPARHLRGQAAIEYFTTYAWAILALLIVVTVLLTSGILSPGQLVSEECNFGNTLTCNFAVFNQGGATQVKMDVFNGFPYKIKIANVRMALQDDPTKTVSGFGQDIALESGATKSFSGIISGPALPENSVVRLMGNITYVSCAPEVSDPDCLNSLSKHTLSGRIVGKVIPSK